MTSNRCVKCGFNPTNGGLLPPFSRSYDFDRDVMIRECWRCGYHWTEPTADKVVPVPEPSPVRRWWQFWRAA